MRQPPGRPAASAGGGIGGELAVADGGVDQDDVLGVDQAGGAGAGDCVAGQVGELAVRWRGLAVMTARTPPGRSARWQAAYTSPGSGPSLAGLRPAAGAAAGGRASR